MISVTYTFNIFPIYNVYSAIYRRYCETHYVFIQGAIISYPRRVIKMGSLSRGYTLLFTSSSSSSPSAPPSSSGLQRAKRNIFRCINQAGHVDRSNKGWRNGKGKERAKRSWKEGGWNFAGRRKIGKRKRVQKYTCGEDGEGGISGETGLYCASCVVGTLAEEFGRRLRLAEERSGTREERGPGGRVEQRLPN